MKWLKGILAAAFMAVAAPALATTCPSSPYNLANGNTADATQVMANFNSIISCLNLSVLPVANPTFTGTMNGVNLVLSGTATLSGGVNGNITASGNIVADGGQIGAAAAYGANRGVFLYTGGALRWIAVEDASAESGSDAGSNFGIARYHDNGLIIDTPFAINRATGIVSLIDGLTIGGNGLNITAGGLTVTGPLSLPTGSVTGAMLNNINATPGICGSASTTCYVTFDAQGRASATSSVAIQPDTCSAGANGYCKNPNGIITQWGVYDCGSSACWNSTSTVTVSLPTTCPNGFYSAEATGYNPGGVSSPRTPTIIGVAGSPVNQLNVRGDGASDEGFYWTVICH